MATIRGQSQTFSINASNDYVLGNSSDVGENGGWIVQLADTGSYSGSVVIKAQSRMIDTLTAQGITTADAFLAIKYRGGNVNGTAADWSYVSTALTTNSLIFIPAGGMDAVLSVTFTSGTAVVYVMPVLGSCSF